MKTKFAATALILASGLIVNSMALAGDRSVQNRTARSYAVFTGLTQNGSPSGVTREQVKAEFAEAVRTGNITTNGERGLQLNELYPSLYPAKPVQASVTREQVKAELVAALRTGDFYLNRENGGKCNEVHPAMHPAQ